MAYHPIPTPEDLKLAEAKTLAWSEGYATARAQCVAAAYAAADAFKIDRDTFARVLVHALNAPRLLG